MQQSFVAGHAPLNTIMYFTLSVRNLKLRVIVDSAQKKLAPS